MQDPRCLTTSTQDKSRNPAAPSPTHSSHSTLQRLSLKQQGVSGGEKDLRPGERLFWGQAERKRQPKVLHDKKKKKISFSNDNQRSNPSSRGCSHFEGTIQ